MVVANRDQRVQSIVLGDPVFRHSIENVKTRLPSFLTGIDRLFGNFTIGAKVTVGGEATSAPPFHVPSTCPFCLLKP
jgi:hypothetical protein